ncbi:MAG: alpha/beta hydrolase [Prochlorococcaceae cyanobacterium ETNP14_MAG_4]|nr:alpha/beta hydrolase [Prochlorococcaceae cyanobacterium ETNP14_MAG_4]
MKSEEIDSAETLIHRLIPELLDPLARELAKQVQWWPLSGLNTGSTTKPFPYPVVLTGKGSPLLLLHGFDSSFLEFRRLAPLLSAHHQLVIPDLHGFGFSPRPPDAEYGPESLIRHLDKVLANMPCSSPLGVIGASMGGAIAMKLARLHPKRINRLLLLSPAGLTGRPKPIPRGLDRLGVWILSRPEVRRRICQQAFADPNTCVGDAEEQIASLHLQVSGWGRSLAAFARSGGMANCGAPLPKQPFHVIWGANDRILSRSQRQEALSLFGTHVEELDDCGHLPHLDHPKVVAQRWLKAFP